MAAGLKTIVLLSLVLACGFLLVTLACALFGNWFPLISVALFCIAPLPNALTKSNDVLEVNSGAVDAGRFFTGFLVASGLILPISLAHCEAIQPQAMVMSLAGGVLIYLSLITFSLVFNEDEEF